MIQKSVLVERSRRDVLCTALVGGLAALVVPGASSLAQQEWLCFTSHPAPTEDGRETTEAAHTLYF